MLWNVGGERERASRCLQISDVSPELEFVLEVWRFNSFFSQQLIERPQSKTTGETGHEGEKVKHGVDLCPSASSAVPLELRRSLSGGQ